MTASSVSAAGCIISGVLRLKDEDEFVISNGAVKVGDSHYVFIDPLHPDLNVKSVQSYKVLLTFQKVVSTKRTSDKKLGLSLHNKWLPKKTDLESLSTFSSEFDIYKARVSVIVRIAIQGQSSKFYVLEHECFFAQNDEQYKIYSDAAVVRFQQRLIENQRRKMEVERKEKEVESKVASSASPPTAAVPPRGVSTPPATTPPPSTNPLLRSVPAIPATVTPVTPTAVASTPAAPPSARLAPSTVPAGTVPAKARLMMIPNVRNL